MTFSAKILEDSISDQRCRLTTIEATFPRFILAELNTHRMLSRNSASSRAIPNRRMIGLAKNDPFVPEQWGTNMAGMSAGEDIPVYNIATARARWLEARDHAVHAAEQLDKINVHKQLVNRLLEPFLWHTAIISATEWDNFLHLRVRADAQPEMQKLARLILKALNDSTPEKVEYDEWHLPHVLPHERETLSPLVAATVSAARCARVSYNRTLEYDTAKDIELADKLIINGHMSPFEHPAQCLRVPARWANYRGWKQYRALIPNEHDPLGASHGR